MKRFEYWSTRVAIAFVVVTGVFAVLHAPRMAIIAAILSILAVILTLVFE